MQIDGYYPVSLNKLLACHWAKRRRLKRAQYDLIALHCRLADLPKADAPRSLSLHFVLTKGMRRLDEDNLYKALQDALVACGALVNDSPKWCHRGTVSYSRGEKLSTTIYLEDPD